MYLYVIYLNDIWPYFLQSVQLFCLYLNKINALPNYDKKVF